MEFLTEHAWPLLVKGGFLMIPLMLLAVVIYYATFEVYIFLIANRFYKMDPNTWRAWVDRPEDGSGKAGEIIRYTQEGTVDPVQVRARFSEVRSAYLPRVLARARFVTILCGVAPLTGLLGTVIGMLATFKGLAISTAGNTIDLVAGGISEALITTQTGLIIAIPAYFLISRIDRHRLEMEAFFIRVESVTLKMLERRHRLASPPLPSA
ncbi:MAG: MotA/TolQ/ExbB proton channel family protein [Opitutales bacterium]